MAGYRRFSFGMSLLATLVAGQAVAQTAGQINDPRLVTAMKNRDLTSVRSYLAEGVGVNTPDRETATALHWAAHWNDEDAVRLLLDAGADPNTPNRFNVVPLHEAALQRNPMIVEALLDAGADPNAAFGDGETVLMTAARTGDAEVVRLLLDHGGDPSATEGWHGQTAIMWAAQEGHAATVKLLIDAGADVNLASTAHDWVKIDYSAGNVPKTRDLGGLRPLHFAARHGSVGVIDDLLTAGAEIDATEPMYELTPLQTAIVNGHYAFAAKLIERGANVNDGSVYLAVDTRNLGFYAQRPNPALKDDGVTSLAVITMLLEHGADADVAYTKGIPERTVARQITVPQGATPLDRAATANDFDAIRVLVAHGANPSVAADDGVTPLLLLAGYTRGRGGDMDDSPERNEAARILLDAGADPNVVHPESGNTALHYAAENGVENLINLIANRGGNGTIKNADGQTAWELAEGADFISGASAPYP